LNKTLVFIAVILLIVVAVGNIIATHEYLTEQHPGHNDFMSRWEGARSFWRDGLNPYGERASRNIQERIYGRAAGQDEDPGYFAYPFYTVFLVWPLVYVDYAWASAVWMVLLEACLIGAVILLIDLYRWRVGPGMLTLLLFWTVLYYFAARGLLLGQPSLLVYFLYVLVFWALNKRSDVLAGMALALSTIKPQMGFLLVPFLLLCGLRFGRTTFVGSFVALWGALMILSFALQPTWFGDWIEQLRRYPSYTALGAPVWIVMNYYLDLGTVGEWAVNLALYVVLLWGWYSVLAQRKVSRVDWAIMLTLTITNLAAIRTATPHYVVFNIPLFYYLRLLTQRDRRIGALWGLFILSGLFILPWVHFLLTVKGEFEHPSVYLPLPFLMLLLLWFTRHHWWSAESLTGIGEV